MDKTELRVLTDIEKYGCHIIHVIGENGFPPMSYSIGIYQSYQQPEVVIIGLKNEISHSMINHYNSLLKQGITFKDEEFADGFIENHKVQFSTVSKKFYKEYFSWSTWYNKGTNFPAFQIIYPTTFGDWPWDFKDDPESYNWQPILR